MLQRNRSELRMILRRLGVHTNPSSTREELESLIDAVENGDLISSSDPQDGLRTRLQGAIEHHFRTIRTQLPNCPGDCMKRVCPPAIVTRCGIMFEHVLAAPR
ncbi:hypothetical protein EBT31_00045 [bacterium]|nr:hypothetical protein [bacterium]